MTIKELVKLFYENRAKGMWSSDNNKDENGMRAVVEALRDEIEDTYEREGCSWDGAHAYNRFNEILGDAGEKAAGVTGPDPVGAGLSPASGQTPAADPYEPITGVTDYLLGRSSDPSPAVCEWTKGRDIFDGTRWSLPSCAPWTYAGVDYKTCPSCGKPISFKEAK